MAENKTVSTRITPEIDERLQTVVDASNTSKADYIRETLKDSLSSDYESLSEEDQILAELSEVKRGVEDADQQENSSGVLPDPFGLFG